MLHDSADDQNFESSLDKEVERLARLPNLDYELCRKEVAGRFGVRTSVLDSEVANARRDDGGDTGRQGQPLGLDDPEPWPESVDGDALLDEIVMRIRRYLVLPDGGAEVLALWAVHAHAFEAFYFTPRLAITAPEKQCGKTVVLDVLECLTPRSIRTENLTTAVLFRIVDAHQPTLLVDEFDTFLKHSDELRGAINAGHRRGGVMLRCDGDDNEVRAFKTFAPVDMAGIGNLPETIADRSISISMRRALPDETVKPFRGDRAHHECELSRRIARWVADNYSALEAHEPNVPCWMFNRQADNWRPLLTIADLAGGDWPEHARAVAEKVCGSDEDETSVRVQLLMDIGELFQKHNTDRLASALIAQELAEMEDRPWPEWGKAGKPISKVQVARQLKYFNISSGTIRDGAKTEKGYKLEHLEDALSRYGRFQSVTTSQTNVSRTYSDFQNVTAGPSVTFQKAEKLKDSAGCDVVTLQTGGLGLMDMKQAEKSGADDFEERAAIMEFDGELSREEAEKFAASSPMERYEE